jgi:hypothetical protein
MIYLIYWVCFFYSDIYHLQLRCFGLVIAIYKGQNNWLYKQHIYAFITLVLASIFSELFDSYFPIIDNQLMESLVKLSFSVVIFINLMGELYYAVIMFVYPILSFNKIDFNIFTRN